MICAVFRHRSEVMQQRGLNQLVVCKGAGDGEEIYQAINAQCDFIWELHSTYFKGHIVVRRHRWQLMIEIRRPCFS